jgi:two-component system phosphate regulon response regulator PhoB
MLLILEDEIQSADTLASFLEHHGYPTTVAYDGHQAIDALSNAPEAFTLAVLDIMVPGPDGRAVCRFIRSHPALRQIPVIFLTARDQEQDEIDGLSIGADDYIPKPASLNLVLAHIKTLLRRRQAESKPFLNIGELLLDPNARSVSLAGAPVDLTATEYLILHLLMTNPNRVFSRQEILGRISDDKDIFDRTVDAHIKNLRMKLAHEGARIRTVRGVGYGVRA